MRFFIFIMLLSLKCFSQNEDTYFSFRINEDLYEYFDSSKVERMENPDTCECVFEITTKFKINSEKREAYDSILLNELADEWLLDDIIFSLKKDFNKDKIRESISSVYIETSVIQLKNRFNILRWKRKVKYKLHINLYYKVKPNYLNPSYEKKEN